MNNEVEKNCCGCKVSWCGKHWVLILIGLALTVWIFVKIASDVRAYHYIGEQNGPATITVSGTGDVLATPDIATFSFTVTNEADLVSDAQTKTTTEINSITDFLKKNDIASTDIQTTDYSIYPQYEYQNTVCPMYSSLNSSAVVCPPSKNVLTGYNVSESITVKIRDLSTAGTILSGIGEFGATNVSGLSFTEDNYNDLVKQSEQKAISDAKTNADALAKSLGVKIVRLVSYSNQNSGPIMYTAMSVSNSAVPKAAAPDIEAGQNKITADVTLVYEVR